MKNHKQTRRILKNKGYSKPSFIKNVPIKVLEAEKTNKIVRCVDKAFSLNKRLNEMGDKKTDERVRIEEEIKKTGAEIDELVYKIYGITEKEKETIKESLK